MEAEGRSVEIIAMNEEKHDVLLTPWSIVHFFSGAACKGLGWGFWTTFGLHALYEYKDYLAHPDIIYNSPVNSIGDQATAMVGWYMGKVGDRKMFLLWLVSFAAALFTKEELKVDIG